MSVGPHPWRPIRRGASIYYIKYTNPTWVKVAKARAKIDAQAEMIMSF